MVTVAVGWKLCHREKRPIRIRMCFPEPREGKLRSATAAGAEVQGPKGMRPAAGGFAFLLEVYYFHSRKGPLSLQWRK